jgi:predicted dehydrogenase
MLQLMGMPSSVISSASYEGDTDISFHATYTFDKTRSCSINVSWLGSAKRREALIFSKKNELHCNLLTQSIVELSQLRTPRRDDDHFLPQIINRSTKINLAREEPLKLELKSFIGSITCDKPVAVSLSDAMNVHHLLSCAYRSATEGQRIIIS